MTVERWRPSRAVTRMHPFRDFDELENRFEEYFGRPIWLSEERLNWMPPIDIYEKGDKYIVKAELPGMKEEDIKVSIIDNTLQIKGEKKSEGEIKNEDYYRCERSYGSFYRMIPLPVKVKHEKIQADYEDGVLEITLTKSPESSPKRVAVSRKKKTGK